MDASQQKTIVVVEDDEQITRLLLLQLESAGYDVHTESSGRPALEYLLDHQPSLVILDLRLPDLDGYEICRELRKVYHSWIVPVMMLTGLGRPADQLRGYACGADAYLTKPFTQEELFETIALLLGETTAPA